MRRPSSARTSSACSATAPTNISRTPTSGARASILTIFLRWKPNRSKLFEKDRHSAEYRFRNIDGTYRWLSDEQHLIRDDKGEPLEIVGSWSDITQRKAAEQAEDALKARIALLLESAPAVVYSFAATGDFAPTFISENVKRVLGYCPDEYLKNADFWRARVHPEDLAAVEAEQAKLFEHGSHTAEYRFRKKDGTYCWVSDEQHLIRDHHGQPMEVVGSWSEVTARKTAEQAALQASEQRLTDAIESISEGFSLYDAQDRLVLGNYKYKELFDHGEGPPKPGMTYEEILRTVVESGLIQDARSRPEAWIDERLAQHRNPGEPVLEHRANGSWIQVSERRTENAGRVAVYSDLTELKESEQRAAAANLLILQSLRYARRIQAAILPQLRELATVSDDHFLIWEPRDIVGGDFFWFQPIRDGHAVIVGDCTGHGVPGAFMTLVAWGMLDRMLQLAPSENPSEVLAGLHRGVQTLLGQDQKTGETDDGLEAGVCFINPDRRKMTFAGARFSLWRSNEKGVTEIKGDRKGVGYRRYPKETSFTDVTLAYRARGLLLHDHRRPDRSDRRPARAILRQEPLPEAAKEISRTSDEDTGRGGAHGAGQVSGPADQARRPHHPGLCAARTLGDATTWTDATSSTSAPRCKGKALFLPLAAT